MPVTTIPDTTPQAVQAESQKRSFSALAVKVLPYLLIVALQLKVMWGIWDYHDLTTGDTSSYFMGVCRLLFCGHVSFAWSPLYSAFGAAMLWISEHALFWCIAGRLVIAVTMTLLVLAFMRRMLPPVWAWLAAAWWAVLPINFNTLYEVHLFSAIPAVACLIASTGRNTLWRRSLIFGALVFLSIGIRNEFSVASAVFLAACLVYEYKRKTPLRSLIVSYGLSSLLAGLSILLIFLNADVSLETHQKSFRRKHELNIAQIYAFGYQQRNPDYTVNPWTDFGPLTKATFGMAEPSLVKAVISNPTAMAQHFWWNASLIPAGLQVLMFNSTCFNVNPDYAPVEQKFWLPILLTAYCFFVSVGGAVCCIRSPGFIKVWSQERFLTLALMVAFGVVSTTVMLIQRPRPSYLFVLEITLILFVVFFAWRLFEGIKNEAMNKLAPRAKFLIPAVALVLVFILPSYYQEHKSERRLLAYYELLYPFRHSIVNSGEPVSVLQYPFELNSYVTAPLRFELLHQKGVPTELLHIQPSFEELRPGDLPASATTKSGWAVIEKKTFGPHAEQTLLAANWKRMAVNEPNGLVLFYKRGKRLEL